MYSLLSVSLFSQVRWAAKETSGSRETSSPTSAKVWLSPWGQNKSAATRPAQYRGPANRQHYPTADSFACRPPGLLQWKHTNPAFTRSRCSPHTKYTFPRKTSPITSESKQTYRCTSFGRRCEGITWRSGNTGDTAWWPRNKRGACGLASTIRSPCVR